MDGLIYLFAAFTAVWIMLFLYIFRLSKKQQRLQREIETLKEHLDAKDTEET